MCKIIECDKKNIARGMCSKHYQQWRLKNLDQTNPTVKNVGVPCLTGCGNPAFSKMYCKKCYNKEFVSKVGAGNGKSYGIYRKEKRLQPNGYFVWYDKNSIHANAYGHVYEHRHVMGEHLGRRLLREENVHHKNGDRSDNRLENLELWSKSQPPGQRVKDKVKWAYEIITLYEGQLND